MCSLIGFEVIFHLMKNLRLHTVSIHINLYQNWFLNECATKKFVKTRKGVRTGGLFCEM